MKNVFTIVSAICFALVIGCSSVKQPKTKYEKPAGIMFQTGFNEENYVWESFMFPTNRTER